MKAAFIEAVGSADQIRYDDLPEPVVGAGDVLVQVAAVAVDPVDCLIRSGRVPMELPFPFIIGRDMVGTVERVGARVSRFAPGDRVWANNQGFAGRQGTFAERLAIDEKLLYPLPPGVDERQMVAFVHSALTAQIGLARVGLKAGEAIYVQGGAGNVGSAIAQFAKARGANVFATAGDADAVAWCRSLGVDGVGNYKTDDLATNAAKFAPGGFDVFWDASGHIDFDQAIGAVRAGGRIVVMAGITQRPPFPVGPFYVKNCTLHGFAVTYATADDYDRAAAEINRFVAGGNMRVRIDRELPLAEAAEAHRMVDEGVRLSGKLVLVP